MDMKWRQVNTMIIKVLVETVYFDFIKHFGQLPGHLTAG